MNSLGTAGTGWMESHDEWLHFAKCLMIERQGWYEDLAITARFGETCCRVWNSDWAIHSCGGSILWARLRGHALYRTASE